MAIIRLSHNSHAGVPGVCLAEVASLLLARKIVRNGVVDPDYLSSDKVHNPQCLSTPVIFAVHHVNDVMDEDELWRLAPLLPRLLRARRVTTDDEAVEDRIRLRLAIWAARYVLHKVDPRQQERALHLIEIAESHLWEPSTETYPCTWEPGFDTAVRTAIAAASDHRTQINAIWAAISCLDDEDLPMFLSDLLDAHEKALATEGCSVWDPDSDYPPDDEVDAVVQALLAGRSNIGSGDIVSGRG